MELAANARVGKYVVEDVLGRGGMAVVYRVRHEDLGVHYALKVLSLHAPALQERLKREGRFQAALRHPNVVSVIDVLTVEGNPALVMEFVDGPSLEALMAVHPLTLPQVDEVARGLLKGVRAAHAFGLVHRDLKPGNVLMARADGAYLPKIADFGLAKAVAGDDTSAVQTRTGAMMGTPCYMAPEQFRGSKAVDARADVYSLGVMLYEMLCGQRPYPGDDLLELADVLTRGGWVPIGERRPDLPDRMVDAIEGAMVLDPARRIPDVETLYAIWTGRADRPEEQTSAFDRAAVRQIEQQIASQLGPPPVLRSAASHTVGESLLDDLPSLGPGRALAAPAPPPAVAERPALAPRSPGWLPALGGMVAILTALVVLLLGTALIGGVFVAVRTTDPAPVVAPPRPELRPRPDVLPPPPAPPAVVEVPPAPPEPPPPPAGPVGRVELKGDLPSVRAIADDGKIYTVPGYLPAGTYREVKVANPNENAPELIWELRSPLEVRSGETVTLRCDSRLASCKFIPFP